MEAKDRIIHSEPDIGMSRTAVKVWFHRHYQSLGFTFVTQWPAPGTYAEPHPGEANMQSASSGSERLSGPRTSPNFLSRLGYRATNNKAAYLGGLVATNSRLPNSRRSI